MAKLKIPNNPMQAYQRGRLDGTRENMDMVAMCLLDKCGFHVHDNGEDEHETNSIEFLYKCLVSLTDEINNGMVKRKCIKDILNDEYGTAFDD